MRKIKNNYGLPQKVKFCKNCVISNQRPSSTVEFKSTSDQLKKGISFDENELCSACLFTIKRIKK